MTINVDRKYCYRICNIRNLEHILEAGLCTKNHPDASQQFFPIGNFEIIGVRDLTPVKIEGYGKIGDYVPFYFTPRSIMLYNIITGYKAPVVPQLSPEDMIVIRAEIEELSRNRHFFFTDGQANTALSKHYNNLRDLDKIDWESIQQSNFQKSDEDTDRPRRYQAEFLVHSHVPLESIESFLVYNEKVATIVNTNLNLAGLNIPVRVAPICFFS
ncbi:DUF4433 domain-containing protein [Dyadobacter sp. CY347]|uniref:type II toxin-antitoxin system toxin DNA ADP-ribosyl transferase DarT n=1 Tax=Dyadobacter sp. CY347 TaxID=2909336 RepID=UPI001F2588A6|nr:DUF4433 domain-containing protein [Dyadobacter sp. CY347]MCF2490814.1 DUF4433 domain-containing protein [Dyadobacter sp. CY347]